MIKKNYYSVIIVSGKTSSTKKFTISSKRVRNSLIAFFVLLVIFGFILFDYLRMSFNIEEVKKLQNRIIELEKEKKQSFLSKRGDLERKFIVLSELEKSLESIRKDISSKKEFIQRKISLEKEIENSQKKLKSIKDEIKKRKPLLELTRKQVKIVANETRKEVSKAYSEKLPWEITLTFFASILASFIGGYLYGLYSTKKKEKTN